MVENEQHGHHHHTGIKWLDLVLAGSAILISVVSLFVSIEHGRTMEKLVDTNARQVRASTLPVLRYATGNLDTDGRSPAINFYLSNGGTGPAIIQWLTLSYEGRHVDDAARMLDACCRSDRHQGLTSITSAASGQTLTAGSSITLFSARPKGGDPELFRRLEGSRHQFRPAACYCSVLDECWVTTFGSAPPRQVAACPAPPGSTW